MSLKTNNNIPLHKWNGVFIMEVFFIDRDGKKISGEIIVDSGASECVMPKGMLLKPREDGS